MPIHLPYGKSSFEKVVQDGDHYVDRTRYIEVLEGLSTSYHFYLRPRRFGKSLMASMLECYYGRQYKDRFEALFGQYYIGRHPTPKANGYVVLKFDFSGIRTDSLDLVERDFNGRVREGMEASLGPLKLPLPPDMLRPTGAALPANMALGGLLSFLKGHLPDERVMVLIDEYDHFTNQLVARSVEEFQAVVGKDGFLRAFYEVLKHGTGTGVIDRIFITGVSPITLDSLSSGFNIGTDLTRDLEMHDMMGFTPDEVAALLPLAGVPDGLHAAVMDDLRRWYDGYRFNHQAPHSLYNPDMVLYFLKDYARYGAYPLSLLDANIASDYHKVGQMFRVGDPAVNLPVLRDLVEGPDEWVTGAVTERYSFARAWTRDDFTSLLFYMGLLTIHGVEFGPLLRFVMPNLVIKELYYGFLEEVLMRDAHLTAVDFRMVGRMATLARESDMRPLAEALGMVLQGLDNRDARQFGEVSAKTALLALAIPTGVYTIRSEYPIGQGYADVVMLHRPPHYGAKNQHLLEIKHLKKKDATPRAVEAAAAEGRTQIRTHLAHPDMRLHPDLIGWLMVVVGYEVRVLERIPL